MYITVQYEGKGVGGISNADGEYQVETRKGWNELTFSAIGYITKKVKFAPRYEKCSTWRWRLPM